jgi:DNA-binding CsgD family transcriptional regulator
VSPTDARLLELIGDVCGLLDLEEFRHGLISALRRAIGCDWVSLNEIGPAPGDVRVLVEPEIPIDGVERFARYAHQNPLIAYSMDSRRGSARRISDFLSPAEFHALDLYREFYGPIGLEHQIAFTLPQEPPRLLGVALSRRERDFSDAERDFIDRARPFLIQAYRNAIAFESADAARADGPALAAALRGAGLTPRQAQVIALVAHGRSSADAAASLGISTRTVDKHLQSAFAALGVKTRSQAAGRAWSLLGGPTPTPAPPGAEPQT